jgi:hypothetical protein
MAAPLTDEGRFPAVQKITKAEYDHFVKTCAQQPKPSQNLIALMSAFKKDK